MEVLKKLFEQHFHAPPEKVQPLQGELGGSGRKIIRLGNSKSSAIGILYGVREENAAFVSFARHFRKHGLPVPEIYGEDLAAGAYLEQDLGDTTLFEFLGKNRHDDVISPQVIEAYRKVVAELPRFQVQAGKDLDYSVCYPCASFDRQSIHWDLNYFKYYFVRLAGIPFSESALESDFSRLSDFLLSANCDFFLYRDFQSRNVMLCHDRPYFLDYQGGRKGALQYDIASLLFDAKADLPPELREQLLTHYLNSLEGHLQFSRGEFLHYYYAYVYVRIMQALGAYGFRGFYERRAHFLQSVPYALKNLRWLLHNVQLPIALPTLMGAFTSMLSSEKLLGLAGQADQLTVRVFSFSFHKGLPKDESGNGGGFVFDGRSVAQSRPRRALPGSHRQGSAGDRLFESAGKCSPISGQRDVAGRCQREHLSGARLQELDGVVRLHRRPASLGFSGRTAGKTPARAKRCSGRRRAPGPESAAGRKPVREEFAMKALQ